MSACSPPARYAASATRSCLHGRVYSPPFKITAIGDPAAMQRALNASEGVRLFKDAVDHYQLGYQETVEADVTVPAFTGSSALRSAEVPH